MKVSTTLVGFVLLTGTYLVWNIIYNLFFSPLRSIPGPFLAKITGQWLRFVDLAGYRTVTLHRLHQKYGHVVRVGPQEVSFSNPSVVRELYSQQTSFMKAPLYDDMSSGPPGIFAMRNKEDHRNRRRLLSHAFSLGNLYETEPLILDKVQKLVDQIESRLGQAYNVMVGFRMFSLDAIGELFFGQSFGALEQLEPPQYVHDLDTVFLLTGIRSLLTRPGFYLACKLPIKSWQDFLAAFSRVRQRGFQAFEAYQEKYGEKPQRKDLLTKLIHPPPGEGKLEDIVIPSEISNLVFAGTDTTSSTLMYLFWELAHSTSLQERLRNEIISAFPSEVWPEYKTLASLPFLDAVVTESLRKHPAAPASLQRETPKGGRDLGGYFIPEGTVVSMQCYTTHRDPTCFPNPESFDPDRWINTSEENLKMMKEMFMPFSKGTRACLGIHLAMMELKLVTAALARRFVVSVAPSMKESDMEMKDHFLVLPAGGKCELIFERV